VLARPATSASGAVDNILRCPEYAVDTARNITSCTYGLYFRNKP